LLQYALKHELNTFFFVFECGFKARNTKSLQLNSPEFKLKSLQSPTKCGFKAKNTKSLHFNLPEFKLKRSLQSPTDYVTEGEVF